MFFDFVLFHSCTVWNLYTDMYSFYENSFTVTLVQAITLIRTEIMKMLQYDTKLQIQVHTFFVITTVLQTIILQTDAEKY